MTAKIAVCAALMLFSLTAIASNRASDLVLRGVTDSGDTAELRFGHEPSQEGTLMLLGDKTQTPQRVYPFSYLTSGKRHETQTKTINIVFQDRQQLTLLCDTLSDNCRSLEYVTEGGNTFSIVWQVVRR
jgi:hypothetical protein